MSEPSNAATVDLVLDARKYAAPEAVAHSVCARLSGLGVLTSTGRERRYGLVVIRAVRIERAAVTFPGVAPQPLSAGLLASASARQTAQVHYAIRQQLSDERLESLLWADPGIWTEHEWLAVMAVRSLERTGFEVLVRDDDDATDALWQLARAAELRDRITVKPRVGWCGYGYRTEE